MNQIATAPVAEVAANPSSLNIDVLELQRSSLILEILETMQETNKNKDWLVDRIRQKRQRISVTPEINTIGVLKLCSKELLENVLQHLKGSELDVGVSVPPITKSYHWFFTDIVAASDPKKTALDQARNIILLNKLIEMSDTFKQRDPDTTLVLPTGDGMAIGFDDTPEKPLNLAIEVHKGVNRYNKSRKKDDQVALRIGLESGPVYIIKDLNGNENVWGPGIIMSRRVMDLAEKMNILASANFANQVKMLKPEYRQILHPIGDYQIKHSGQIFIYNIYTDEIGNKKPPSKDKRQKSVAAEEANKTVNRFLFNYIGIEIGVKDAITMLAHHKWTWNLVNVSNEPIERLFYWLEGDKQRAFQDLNVQVKDEDDKEMELLSLNVNRGERKEFFVKFRKPLKPGEKGRMAILEYDWEEPLRNYYWRFASDCKKFEFTLTVPKGMEIRNKVAEVDSETGDKKYSMIPSTVNNFPDKSVMTWAGSNFRAYQAYQFFW